LLSEAQGKDLDTVFDILNEVTRVKPENPVSKVLRLGKVVGLANHTVLIRRDGAELAIEDSAAPIRGRKGEIDGVVLVFHDVTEQKKIERVLRESERLATTGRLAATIAHEIHNPLDTVGNLLFLIEQSTDSGPLRNYVSLASQELARVTQMTQHMLAFQREAAKPVPFKIEGVFDNVAALYEKKLTSAGISLDRRVDFAGEIIAFPGEMRQAFANLVGNAIEAVGKNGTIKLHAYASRDWRCGRRGLRITVSDNGPGIPRELLGKVFEPFFTTKGESGTGLALSSRTKGRYGCEAATERDGRELASRCLFPLNVILNKVLLGHSFHRKFTGKFTGLTSGLNVRGLTLVLSNQYT
jgi:signal transduction histidine kinase